MGRKYNIGEEEEGNGHSNEQNNQNDAKGVKLDSNNKPAKNKGGCCGGGKGKKIKIEGGF